MAVKLNNNDNPTFSQEVCLPLDQSLRIMDVPADGNCLFWAAALSYLLSLRDDQFEEGFKRLFGEDYLIYLQIIKALIEEFFSVASTSLYEHPLLSILISQIFRERVVAYIEFHREVFEPSILADFDSYLSEAFEPSVTADFTSYLERMATPGTWGGDSEIKAISGLLNCTIFVVPSWYNGHRLKFGEGEPALYLFHKTNHYWFALNKEHSFFIKEFHIMANQLDFSTSETDIEAEATTDTDFNKNIFRWEFQSIADNFNSLFGKRSEIKSSHLEKRGAKALSKLGSQLVKKSVLGTFLELSLHIHFSAAAFTYFFFREQSEAPLSLLNYPLVLKRLEPNTHWERETQKEIDCYLSHTICGGYVGLSGALIGASYALFQQYNPSIKKELKRMTSATLSYFFSKPQNDEKKASTPCLGLHKRVGH